MTWRAVHPSLTKEVRVPEDDPSAPTFTVGFWPPLESEKAKLYVSKLRRLQPGPSETTEELLHRAQVDLHAFRDMVRFGVRGWSGLGDLSCMTETVEIDGRRHVALTQESIDVLYHSSLLLPVALACWQFNSLTETEKKTSDSRSSSPVSTSGMPAPGVISASDPARSEAASYESTAGSSTAAPTS